MGAQCVLYRFLYSVEALYSYTALRHATVEALQPLQLYSSTALQPLHSTTLYNTPLLSLFAALFHKV